MRSHFPTTRIPAKRRARLPWGIDPFQPSGKRSRRKQADAMRKSLELVVFVTRPRAQIELDLTSCDIYLVSGASRFLMGQSRLTLAVDRFSAMVVGYHIGFATPSVAWVLEALRNVLPTGPPHPSKQP